MKLPHTLTTITPFSKLLTLIIFVTLPFLGFFIGIKYQKAVDNMQIVTLQEEIMKEKKIPTPTPDENPITNSNLNESITPAKTFFSCPKEKTLSCKPTGNTTPSYCNGEFLEWASKNCPGLLITR